MEVSFWKKVAVGVTIIAGVLGALLSYQSLGYPTLLTSTDGDEIRAEHTLDMVAAEDYSKQNRIFNLRGLVGILDEQRHDKQEEFEVKCLGAVVPQECVKLGSEINELSDDIDSFTKQLQELMKG